MLLQCPMSLSCDWAAGVIFRQLPYICLLEVLQSFLPLRWPLETGKHYSLVSDVTMLVMHDLHVQICRARSSVIRRGLGWINSYIPSKKMNFHPWKVVFTSEFNIAKVSPLSQLYSVNAKALTSVVTQVEPENAHLKTEPKYPNSYCSHPQRILPSNFAWKIGWDREKYLNFFLLHQ